LSLTEKIPGRAWGVLVLLSLIWGSSFIIIKKVLPLYSPGEVGALRILSASLFLLPWSLLRLKGFSSRDWVYLGVVGLFGSFLPAFLFALAQTRIDSSIAGVLNAVTPFSVLLIGAIFFSQRIVTRQGLGLLVGFVGTSVLLLAGSQGQLSQINYFAFFVIGAAVCYGFNVNIIKYKLGEIDSVTITSLSLLIAGPVALVYLVWFSNLNRETITADGALFALGLVVVLGILGTAIALILFNYLVKISTPIFASSVTYLIPIVAVLWGLWDGETLLVGHYIAMALILFGLYITHRRGVRK